MRVGGSVWEFKNDPKRLREEIKNDIEKRRTKRDEKKKIKSEKKSFKKLALKHQTVVGRQEWSAELDFALMSGVVDELKVPQAVITKSPCAVNAWVVRPYTVKLMEIKINAQI